VRVAPPRRRGLFLPFGDALALPRGLLPAVFRPEQVRFEAERLRELAAAAAENRRCPFLMTPHLLEADLLLCWFHVVVVEKTVLVPRQTTAVLFPWIGVSLRKARVNGTKASLPPRLSRLWQS